MPHVRRRKRQFFSRGLIRYDPGIVESVPKARLGDFFHIYLNGTEDSVISREDIIFTIGFDGEAAVVDARAKKDFGSLSSVELAQKGLYRAAFSSALLSESQNEIKQVMDLYNAQAKSSYSTIDEFKKLFGVNMEKAKRTVLL